MIICPKCQHPSYTGALFCSKCGGQLANGGKNHLLPDRSSTEELDAALSRLPGRGNLVTAFKIGFRILESGEILAPEDRAEFTVGRYSEDQQVIPDVDLTPYGAYDAGVSRLHVSIRMLKDSVSVLDLGSSNGTWLNGKKIPPNLPQPVQNGDILILGKLSLQVMLRS